MPAAKEKWEIEYEEYRDTLTSLGAVIKNEKALRMAYKIYREKMPARIYQTCVDEGGSQKPAPVKTPEKNAATPTAGAKETSETQTKTAVSSRETPPKDQSNHTPSASSGHSEATPEKQDRDNGRSFDRKNDRGGNQNKDGKRKTQKERFEDYKSKLTAKGIAINNENGLWELFRSIRGRLDYSQIGEFVTFPERKPRDNNRDNKNRDQNDRKPRNNREKTDSVHNDSKSGARESNPSGKARFDEYRESLMTQGYEIIDQNQLARLYIKQKGFISPEQLKDLIRKAPENKKVINNAGITDTHLPVSIETPLPVIVKGSFADQWVKPLQKWVDTDKDSDGKPKRTLTAIKADNNSVVIDVIPSGKYAEKNKNDSGARYSFTKKNNNGDIESTLGSKDGKPLDYEYFRQLMISYRKNNIGSIAFKNISTNEFRDKLLAAALEFDMKMIDAPEKIDINAPYLQKLPSSVKIKLGIYNGDLNTSGKPISEVKKNILKRKESHRDNPDKDTGGSEKPDETKPRLALPQHISAAREMD